jgi:hypothetical protein
MDVLIRIALRYLAGFLVAKGFLLPDLGDTLQNDPQVLAGIQIAAGFLIGAISEGWYWLAKKLGWRT